MIRAEDENVFWGLVTVIHIDRLERPNRGPCERVKMLQTLLFQYGLEPRASFPLYEGLGVICLEGDPTHDYALAFSAPRVPSQHSASLALSTSILPIF